MNLLQLFAIMALSVSAIAAPVNAASSNNNKSQKSDSQGFKKISTADLKKMIDSKQNITIFDARHKLSGGLLPGAKSLPYDTENKALMKTLAPIAKSQTIVVYCANINCPVSEELAERLVILGYTNVYKYPDGIQGWIDQGLPIDPIKQS